MFSWKQIFLRNFEALNILHLHFEREFMEKLQAKWFVSMLERSVKKWCEI